MISSYSVYFLGCIQLTTSFNYNNIQECEESKDACKPEIAELLAKCKAGLIDYQANVNTIKFEQFATDMKNEQEFLNGLKNQLVPWMDEAEVVANKSLACIINRDSLLYSI